MGVLRFDGNDSRLQVMEADDVIAEIHAIYNIVAEGTRLLVDGWAGAPETHEWTRWIVEMDGQA